MSKQATYVLAVLTLAGCGPMIDSNAWFLSRYKDSAGSLFESESKPREADPRPDAKGLIGENLASVFGRTKVTNVQVGSPRPNGYGWLVCVKANVFGITNQDTGVNYFVVEIDRGQIGLRRPATAADGCESEAFQPV